jgi:hypothetical protein
MPAVSRALVVGLPATQPLIETARRRDVAVTPTTERGRNDFRAIDRLIPALYDD